MSEIVIRVKNLSKCYQIYERPEDRLKQSIVPRLQRFVRRIPTNYYREFWALRDVSFEVHKGETVGIIGRNGSGKSTLLQMICGTLTPSAGTVETNGRIAALLELGTGFNPEFTGRENVYMNGTILGLDREEIDERFDAILAFADIGEFIEQPVKTYSSGMYVRLAFSILANVNADILVIDEALAVGDIFFTQKCMRFLRSFRETGTLLFVSHDTGAVLNLCRFAIYLEKGKIHTMDTAKDACASYLEDYYASQQELDSGTPSGISAPKSPPPIPANDKDQRHSLFIQPPLRNDIELFQFDPKRDSFGSRRAVITNAFLSDEEEGVRFTWVVGGESVKLVVYAEALAWISRIIVGFVVKDRLGQPLFGDNTYFTTLDGPVSAARGQIIKASFRFRMPIMPLGEYAVSIAIADGTQEVHEIHEWHHEAIIFRSQSSHLQNGLLGIPMQEISLSVLT